MLSSRRTANEEGDVTNELGPPADYPIWHGSVPMKAFLAGKLRADRFLVEGDGIRVRDAAGRWYLDARSSCWNLGLGYSAEPVKEAIRQQLEELPNGPLLAYVHLLPVEGGWAANVSSKLEELGPERVSAVIVEPQMGSRGFVPDPDDLVALADLCRRHGVHFIADEVTTGFGRTGAMSRCLDLGIEPDMVVLGKNVTSGYVPIGVLLVSEELYELAAMPDPPRVLTAT